MIDCFCSKKIYIYGVILMATLSFDEFMKRVVERNPGEKEFQDAVKEVMSTTWETFKANKRFVDANIMERIVEPERIIIFRVPWTDDQGKIQVNRGYRVQFNSAIGPYKGGLRFHPAVNLSVMKSLAFEQTFKNALTTLPMGGGKGGADFDPKGKSDAEVMRFCQSYMDELYRHIGPDTDVPAGDVGVGKREVGYMYGQYRRLTNTFTSTFTGKGLAWGGSLVRPEATGFGAVYFGEEVLKRNNETFKGKKVVVSGFGQVAWGVAKKLVELGAKVITISGPDGYVHIPDGMTEEQVEYMLEMRASCRDRAEDFSDKFKNATFHKGVKPWVVPCDVAMTCAIQNECNLDDVKTLMKNGCKMILEVSNMGCTLEAAEYLREQDIEFAPGKAVNAGGVATSGLEMSQNSIRMSWDAAEVDKKLRGIMKGIHDVCYQYGKQDNGKVDYVKGANIGGFMKVAEAMADQGAI